MRADRLLSILMILQARGCTTARQLAEELEVSERTIYRDVIALSTSGVPVYTDRGPGGGISLIESYRTTLTGMDDDEIRALFMLSIPAPLADLGVSEKLKGALLKLEASLPAAARQAESSLRGRVHLDWEPWFRTPEPVPNLQVLLGAIREQRRLRIIYNLPFETRVARVIEPYGLVAKSSLWYLVYFRDHTMRVIRVSRILEAEMLEGGFDRPTGFDLASFWEGWRRDYEGNRPVYDVLLRAAPRALEYMALLYGDHAPELLEVNDVDQAGWSSVLLRLESPEQARYVILGLGGAVEVIEPQALRDSVIDYAEQVLGRY